MWFVYLVGLALAAWIGRKCYLAYQQSAGVLERKAREQTEWLERQLARLPAPPPVQEFVSTVREVFQGFPALRQGVLDGISDCVEALYALEFESDTEKAPTVHNSNEGEAYRARLQACIDRPDAAERYPLLLKATKESMAQFVASLSPITYAPKVPEQPSFRAVVMNVMAGVGESVGNTLGPFWVPECQKLALFPNFSAVYTNNATAIAKDLLSKTAFEDGKSVFPGEHSGSPEEIVYGYLSGLPFVRLYERYFDFGLPEAQRLEHTVIVAGSGHGKSQLLELLMLNEMSKADPPAMILIDSKGDMVERISKLAQFHPDDGRLRDRLIIIDPRDRPALNLFDIDMAALDAYDEVEREQVMNGVVATYEYFFGSLLGAELTSKMSVIFRPLVLLMLHIPAADIHTLIGVLDDISPYRSTIEKLPKGVRRFLENEFGDRSYSETKTQVKRRLYQIVQSETFDRMFSAPKNSIDFSAALNQGKIILINSDKPYLQDYSTIFGRYFISLIITAALRRATIPERERKVAYLFVDEAAAYFDEKTDQLLTTLRSYKLGATFAFQYLGQASDSLRASMTVNTSIKFMGGVEGDAKAFAPAMHTTPEFIDAQTKDGRDPPQHTRFALYIRNALPHAIAVSIPLGFLNEGYWMDDEAYRRLRQINRAYVSGAAPAPGAGEVDAELIFQVTIQAAQAVVGCTTSVLFPDGPRQVLIPPGVKNGARLAVGKARGSDGSVREAFVHVSIEDGPSPASEPAATVSTEPVVRLHHPDLPWKLDRSPENDSTKPAEW